MGTLATFFRKTDFILGTAQASDRETSYAQAAARIREQSAPRAMRDPFELRALPNDDVYFYCKRVDNSRLVRQADPHAKGRCWSAIGAGCIAAVLFGAAMVPKAGALLAGYRLQQLREERAGLLEEIKVVEVEEARVLSPAALDMLASKSKLTSPASGQIVRLAPKGDTAVASVILPGRLQSR